MAPAPAVRDLNALVNEIGQAYKPQYDTIQNDINFNEQSGQGATAGLQAQQRQAFSGIEQAAQNKGMFFSGFSPSEQANYTSTVYLPKLAELNQTIAQTRNALLGRKAELDTDIRNKAFATRESDLSALRTWEQQQAQRAWEAEQNRLKMEFEAKQNAADRTATRAASAASATSKPTRDEYTSAHQLLDAQLRKVKDKGYRPEDFQALPTRGETMANFNNTFRGVISPQEISAMVNKLYGRYYIDK